MKPILLGLLIVAWVFIVTAVVAVIVVAGTMIIEGVI